MPTQGIRTEAQVLNANGTGSLRPNFADASGFDGLLLEIFRWLILASTALAVVFLIIAGLQYATTDAFSKKGEAKRRIQEIMIGLALALS